MDNNTRWYVWVDDKTYGPYDKENLLEFLVPEMYVCPEGGTEWILAKDVSDFSSIFHKPPPEPKVWYVKSAEGVENGPYSRKELDSLISSGEINENDFYKHIDWDDYKLGSTTSIFTKNKNEVAKKSSPPSIEKFKEELIIASDEELKREFNEHWLRYPKDFQKALLSELKKRKLITFFDRIKKLFS